MVQYVSVDLQSCGFLELVLPIPETIGFMILGSVPLRGTVLSGDTVRMPPYLKLWHLPVTLWAPDTNRIRETKSNYCCQE